MEASGISFVLTTQYAGVDDVMCRRAAISQQALETIITFKAESRWRRDSASRGREPDRMTIRDCMVTRREK